MPKPKTDQSERVFATEPTHNNRGLFADHYLDSPDRLRDMKHWREADGLADAIQAIADLYRKAASKFGPKTNESQTEDKFIKPVLKLLGWEWESQEPIAGCGAVPDYALLFTHDDWEALQRKKGTDEYWASVPVLADAKAWACSLDQRRDGETPTVQITNYLYRSNVRWGILTNGQTWRLYERDRSRPGGIYYETDLIELLEHGSPKNFRYFYLFFRRDAFVPVDGASFVERVLQGTIDYATAVGDGLKESVYDALRHLMNGFLDHQGNGLHRHDEGTLRQVHDHCLILLYRLLFVLYAEDRGLLPADQPPYSPYSLKALHQRVNGQLRQGPDFLPAAVTLWHEVLNLFRLIDAGYYQDGRAVIPAYNGGLFSDERFPAIAHTPTPGAPRWDIGDSYLAQAIDMLAYERERWDEPGTRDVDYATLDVQHLGAIYEGLLELKPAVAAEPMIEQPGPSGKAPVLVPQATVAKPKKVRGQLPRAFAAGEVYLVTDRGERKATGSYYTPKYIVDYIVENTVVPLCDEAAEQTADIKKRMEQLDTKRRRARRSQAIQALEREIEDLRARWPDPYLSLKILDPAMGSGHFLVGAADVVSLAMATDPNLPQVPEDEAQDVQGYYKRLVARHCLYGVDLNWLAVELAKLSLWLHTVQRDKALDFLDHHLRCGNSLIGARIEDDLTKQPPPIGPKGKVTPPDDEQLILGFWEAFSQAHLQGFLNVIQKIMDAPDRDADDQRQKNEWFREMERERDRYRQVANCWLAPYFGVPVTAAQYSQAVAALRERAESADWLALADEPWFQDVYAVGGNIHAEPGRDDWRAAIEQELAKREDLSEPRHSFHWELEFPHAFFDGAAGKSEGARGFDAVVGNPPYGLVADASAKSYAVARYYGASGVADSFALFLERGASLCAKDRRLGMIVPGGWLTSEQHAPLRTTMLTECPPLRLVILPYDVFPDAYIDTILYTGEADGSPDAECLVKRYGIRETLRSVDHSNAHAVAVGTWASADGARITTQLTGAKAVLVQHANAVSQSLGSLATITRGVTPFRPAVPAAPEAPTGYFDSIRRYHAADRQRRPVDYGPHLAEYRPISVFRGERLIVRRIISRDFRLECTGATDEFIVNKSNLLVHTTSRYSPWYLLALLNSRLISARFVWLSEIARRDDYPQVDIATLERFPVRAIDWQHPTPTATKTALLQEAGAVPSAESAKTAILAHAALWGPAGKPELQDDPHWEAVIKAADVTFPGREDFVHDLLADLAQRMIDLNKQKHAETHKFLQWLESYTGCSIEDLPGKTKVQAFHEHDPVEILDVLRANRKRITKLDPTTAAFDAKLRAEHAAAMATLAPILDALEKTDRLIDQIVYRLYGLTDEEIAIVEESVG